MPINYEFGKPMLTDQGLAKAGENACELHTWLMGKLQGATTVKDLSIKFRYQNNELCSGTQSDGKLEAQDLYDLFNFGPMVMELVQCYELHLFRENNQHVAFVDPDKVHIMGSTKDTVKEYITNALVELRDNDYIMVPFVNEKHWILIVILLKKKKVWYINSLLEKVIHEDIGQLIDSAYEEYLKITEKDLGSRLEPHFEFPGHQQGPGEHCGFYVCYHMRLIKDKAMKNGCKDIFSIEDSKLKKDEMMSTILSTVQEDLCQFILGEVIDPNGQFHYWSPSD